MGTATPLLADETYVREALEWGLGQWSSLDDADQQALAQAVPLAIGKGTLLEVRSETQGDLTNRVARYDIESGEMVLIVGGAVELGWQRTPLEDLSDTWDAIRAQVDRPHGIQVALAGLQGSEVEEPPMPPKELHQWLDQQLSPRRSVALRPYLIDVAAGRPWDEVKEVAETDPHLRIEKWLRGRGYRLATPDEWEHATSGATRALFRWGDHWPSESTPYDVKDGVAFESNAFGLTMGVDPYWPEAVSDGGQVRGGDGGEMVCGGAPPFATWVTQMSAFMSDLRHIDYRDDCFGQVLYRRVISVLDPHPAPTPFVPASAASGWQR